MILPPALARLHAKEQGLVVALDRELAALRRKRRCSLAAMASSAVFLVTIVVPEGRVFRPLHPGRR